MGACCFTEHSSGATAQDAFCAARDTALALEGCGGYTGTIAAKRDFVMIDVPSAFTGGTEDYIDSLLIDGDERIDDKWGPAGCIRVRDGEFVFFGFASS